MARHRIWWIWWLYFHTTNSLLGTPLGTFPVLQVRLRFPKSLEKSNAFQPNLIGLWIIFLIWGWSVWMLKHMKKSGPCIKIPKGKMESWYTWKLFKSPLFWGLNPKKANPPINTRVIWVSGIYIYTHNKSGSEKKMDLFAVGRSCWRCHPFFTVFFGARLTPMLLIY